MSVKYQFFPKNKKITDDLQDVVDVFDKNYALIKSDNCSLESNKVLSRVANDLECIGYRVEKSKKDDDKIIVPVLYGQNGNLEKKIEVDAYNEEKKVVIEVEAGRAVTNYQFLKDLFEACMMDNVEYLVIAVRNIYRKKDDFKEVVSFIETVYVSNRLQLPLKGILIIGY